MSPVKKALLYYLVPCLAIAATAATYNFFFGFPRRFDGRWVHRVTVWSEESHYRPERMYYAYSGPDHNEVRHGNFRRFDNGRLVQEATYRNGKIDGAIAFWNLLGDKTQEIYYHDGTPYGYANFSQGKLLKMRQEVVQGGRTVAVKSFEQNQYSLQFKCGELINASIDPSSGQVSSIANPSQRACENR
ncbi:MAG TPA: hypothetical protein VE133_19085 [Candidatus Sulfotelmatobacter sp.]|nr:hypothetical protein [Candidatus Sulfotelmatobacter sp.]